MRFRKAGHRGSTIMYSVWKNNVFFNFKPHKHIALHQNKMGGGLIVKGFKRQQLPDLNAN